MKSQIPYSFIAIEGNIGAGKSTLAQLLSKQLNARLILEEFEDNSFLPKFYEDARRYAFPLEMSFLASRFNQLKKQLAEQDLFKEHVICDYIFAKCLLFSKVNLDEDEYDLYYRLFSIIDLQLPKPDLLIYLHCPLEKLQWNIANRGRVYEQKIEEKYLLDLQEAYFSYLHNSPDLRVLMIDCSNLDFVNNTSHYEQILSLMRKPYTPGIHHYHLLDL
ncbi:MAG: deoxynucleoside kinase [Bacteroidota bacterium]|nr:deoxynucleoside kinase [Bacteroidota bacterium]